MFDDTPNVVRRRLTSVIELLMLLPLKWVLRCHCALDSMNVFPALKGKYCLLVLVYFLESSLICVQLRNAVHEGLQGGGSSAYS